MLISTHSIRSKLSSLLQGSHFLSNNVLLNGSLDDEEKMRIWTRYLLSFGCIISEKNNSKKGYIRVQDPAYRRGFLLPKEIAERMLILNAAPPVGLETVHDLSLKSLVREYRIKKYYIPVTREILTKKSLFFFDRQVHASDYPNKNQIKKLQSSLLIKIPLESKILSIKDFSHKETEIEIQANDLKLFLLTSKIHL
jgi:hypothetical protein